MEEYIKLYEGLVLKRSYKGYYTLYVWLHPTLKHYCGYVEVPQDSVLYGLDYESHFLEEIKVHGGLTYSRRIGENWLFGFDCNHAGDNTELYQTPDGHWWTEQQVLDECWSLAEQLKNLEESLCKRCESI